MAESVTLSGLSHTNVLMLFLKNDPSYPSRTSPRLFVHSSAVPSSVVRDVPSLREIRGVEVLEHIAAAGADSTRLAAIDLLNEVRPWVTMITRLRLDAARSRVHDTNRRSAGKPSA